MEEMKEYRPLFDNIVIRNNSVSYDQKSYTQVVVREEELEIDNYLIKNMIINNNIVKENYDIVIIDNNHIKLYRKLMRLRNPVQNFIKQAKLRGYDIDIDEWQLKVCECIVTGEKTVHNDRVTIKYLNRMKKYDEKILNNKIEIKIIDGGYKFIFETNIKD